MAGKFVLFAGRDSQYYWRLQSAGNNEPLLQSEGYTSKQGAQNGIAATKLVAPYDSQYGRHGSYGAYYFVLKAWNNEILGRSEMYTTEAAREDGIEAVKRDAPGATVDDRT